MGEVGWGRETYREKASWGEWKKKARRVKESWSWRQKERDIERIEVEREW